MMKHGLFGSGIVLTLSSVALASPLTYQSHSGRLDLSMTGGLFPGDTTLYRSIDTRDTPAVGGFAFTVGPIARTSATISAATSAHPNVPGAQTNIGGWNINTGHRHDNRFPNGSIDTEAHAFAVSRTGQIVFSVAEAFQSFVYDVNEQAAPFTSILVEPGTWDGSSFTPTGAGINVRSLIGSYSAPFAAGTYRFSYAVETAFSTSEAFNHDTNDPGSHRTTISVNLYTIPSPASFSLLALGGMITSRRRR